MYDVSQKKILQMQDFSSVSVTRLMTGIFFLNFSDAPLKPEKVHFPPSIW